MSNNQCSGNVIVPHNNTSFAKRTVDNIAALIAAWQNRRALYRLGEMSDHELSDIGLTRSDLYAVEGGPLSIDPTARLGALARANRERPGI